MKRIFAAAVIAGGMLAASVSTVSAAPIDVSVVFDLTEGIFIPNTSVNAPGRFEVTAEIDPTILLLQSENTINVSVSFLAGQSLQLYDFTSPSSGSGGFREFVQLVFGPVCSCSTGGSGEMEFTGVTGNLLSNPATAYTNTSGGFTISTDWTTVDLTDTSFGFSGIEILNYSYTLNFVSSKVISPITLSLYSDQVDVLIAPVPLPAGVWLLLSALGGLGFTGWRRKKVAEA